MREGATKEQYLIPYPIIDYRVRRVLPYKESKSNSMESKGGSDLHFFNLQQAFSPKTHNWIMWPPHMYRQTDRQLASLAPLLSNSIHVSGY